MICKFDNSVCICSKSDYCPISPMTSLLDGRERAHQPETEVKGKADEKDNEAEDSISE